MAEVIVSTVLTVVIEKLADVAVNKFVRSQGILSELKKLKRTLSQIQKLLNDASQKELKDEDVKQWLNSLQHLAYDIDDVLDDLATEDMHLELTDQSGAITSKVRKLIPTCCTNISLSNRFVDKLDDITNKLQALEKEKDFLGLSVKDERPKNMSRGNETSLLDGSRIVGRQGDKEKLLQKLLSVDERCDQNFSVLPIVGMGGLGKTTLARLLYNETQVNGHFELKAWVCVSDEFDILKISKTIFESITRENKNFSDLNQCQIALKDQLKEKRFLIVLDDVWSENYDDWENLVRPFHSGAPGSKIVMTTRKEQLLKKLDFDHLEHLHNLGHDDAMSLFALHAFGVDNFDSHPTLKPAGDGIVKKCGGLPLALRALGMALKRKTDKEDWEDVLNSEIWDLEENPDQIQILPALRLSYHDLPANLKQLFAYCSLFHKDFLFDKEDLVLLWMAEGFLNQSRGNKSAERLGHECFEQLLSRSFFQQAPNVESFFVMHDLMNDLATFVAGDYLFRFDNHTEMGNEALTKYRHMSFIREEYVAYKNFEAFKNAKSLRTFLTVSVGPLKAWNGFYISNKILFDLLPELPLLRVLSLSCFKIEEVPEFIGDLKHLRYLNLSQTRIKSLPENVGNLYNLQTLIVCGCHNLTRLPESFLKLKKLRHFDVRDTPSLKKMPLGIDKLKGIQTLTKIIIRKDDGFTITTLKGLKNLHGKISIEGLDKVQRAIHAREANMSLKKFTELELKWGDVFDGSQNETREKEVLYELKPQSEKLKKLEIVSYKGMEFPNWVGDPSFCHLVHVSIRCCRKCTSLLALGRLPLLKELFIEDLDDVEVIGSEFLGTSTVSFRSLEDLRIKNMSRWKEWSMNSEVVDVVFPCLRDLQIENCPDLVDVSLEALPSLRFLKIRECGDSVLRSLVQVASSITKLEIKSISGLTDEVWRGVVQSLGAVEEIDMRRCNEIKYLWESEAEASKVLTNLRNLEIYFCSNLVSLGEKEDNFGGNLLTSLTTLTAMNCNSMERCCCPSSIESLSIYGCSSVTCVSFPAAKGGGQNLKSLAVSDCDKLMEKIDNTSMPMLEFVFIDRWPNLKSIIELGNFIHVTNLHISKCQSLELFPTTLLPNLTSLKDLRITECPHMDVSFLSGSWPPKLESLSLGRLKKPISEWGPQNFPASLYYLGLFGEDVSSFNELPDLLPSSLTSLGIVEFKKLETLSTGLQHLTALQHLFIIRCPELIHLPESLFPSLLRLYITHCPNVKDWKNKKGPKWPLISHIPCIDEDSDEEEDEE